LPTAVSNIADSRQPFCRQSSATLPTAVGNEKQRLKNEADTTE
jgi:hypothetical protein